MKALLYDNEGSACSLPVESMMELLPFGVNGLALKFSDHNICPTWLTKPLTALTVGQVSGFAQALQGRLVDTPIDLPKITSKKFVSLQPLASVLSMNRSPRKYKGMR
jgi:hypothetical protein